MLRNLFRTRPDPRATYALLPLTERGSTRTQPVGVALVRLRSDELEEIAVQIEAALARDAEAGQVAAIHRVIRSRLGRGEPLPFPSDWILFGPRRSQRLYQDFLNDVRQLGRPVFVAGGMLPNIRRSCTAGVRAHIGRGTAYWSAKVAGRDVVTHVMTTNDTLAGRILLGGNEMVAAHFRQIAAEHPARALELVEHGVAVIGGTSRPVAPHISAADLEPVFRIGNAESRTRAIALLGTLRQPPERKASA